MLVARVLNSAVPPSAAHSKGRRLQIVFVEAAGIHAAIHTIRAMVQVTCPLGTIKQRTLGALISIDDKVREDRGEPFEWIQVHACRLTVASSSAQTPR